SDTTGAVTTINRYDEYGKPQNTNAGRFQYTGQTWLPELGAYYYKARMYEPTFGGRFLQTDPIGYTGGMNLYSYVENDPVNWTDPLGLISLNCYTVRPTTIVEWVLVKGELVQQETVTGSSTYCSQGFSEPGGSRGGGVRGGGGREKPPRLQRTPKTDRVTRPPGPSKKRSTCAAGIVGGGIGALMLIPEAQGAALGISFAAAEGIAAGIITGGVAFIAIGVGALVYYYDQKNNNASAKAINRSGIAC
ncbi:MAG: RHS repeat-associated core domain-containing protein, partial [Sphingomonas bacterium]|nr:RHS repeat-associated core domain-containing protein [Sphingomonas bacterium]